MLLLLFAFYFSISIQAALFCPINLKREIREAICRNITVVYIHNTYPNITFICYDIRNNRNHLVSRMFGDMKCIYKSMNRAMFPSVIKKKNVIVGKTLWYKRKNTLCIMLL